MLGALLYLEINVNILEDNYWLSSFCYCKINIIMLKLVKVGMVMEKSKKIQLLELLSIILFYFIVGNNNIYVFVVSFCLYKVFSAFFSNITILNKIKKYNSNYSKYKLFKLVSLIISVISLLFLLGSIFVSDLTQNFLNIHDSFLVFLFMGLSVLVEPLIKIFAEYLLSYKLNKISNYLVNGYYYLEIVLFLIISFICFRLFNINNILAMSFLYLSKIISGLVIITLSYLIIRNKNKKLVNKNINVNYKKDIKDIFTSNINNSSKLIIKNSFYYISVIVIYIVLSSRYSYASDDISKIITFIYFFLISIVDILINNIILLVKSINKDKNIMDMILILFDKLLSLTVIFGVVSPLVCRIIFNSSEYSIYLLMVNLMIMFIGLFNITFDSIKNNKIIYLSLIISLVTKVILILPLIDSFYRMGYNLIYGDIFSTIIGFSFGIVINYIYLKNRNSGYKCFDKILKSMYENIILCIILVIMQFIVPIKTDSYFYSILLLIIYLFVSIMFLNFKKKRG